MAYTGTLCTEAEITFLAGKLVDETGNVEANHNYAVGWAESYLCNLLQYDVVTNWASLNSKYKLMMSEYVARMAAISMIAYNMAGYTTRIEAEDIINIHWARCQQIEELLLKKSVKDFLGV